MLRHVRNIGMFWSILEAWEFMNGRMMKFRSRIRMGKNAKASRGCYFSCDRMNGIRIGDNSFFGMNCIVDADDGRIIIGKNTTFNHNCVLFGKFGIEIGNDCLVSEGVKILSQGHEYRGRNLVREQGMTGERIRIGDDVWIGACAIILQDVIIGDRCVIGAGSVIAKDVPEGSVVVGNPQRIISKR